MSADSVLAEALARMEHKLDLLLIATAYGTTGSFSKPPLPLMFKMFPQVGDQGLMCPVCTAPVEYLVDIMNKVVTRKCGCTTGKQAPIDLEQFAAPQPMPGRTDNGADTGSNDQGGINPGTGRRSGKQGGTPGR